MIALGCSRAVRAIYAKFARPGPEAQKFAPTGPAGITWSTPIARYRNEWPFSSFIPLGTLGKFILLLGCLL